MKSNNFTVKDKDKIEFKDLKKICKKLPKETVIILPKGTMKSLSKELGFPDDVIIERMRIE